MRRRFVHESPFVFCLVHETQSRHNHTAAAYGDGRKFEYEMLNFVDGERSVSDIRERIAAYLAASESIGVAHENNKGQNR